MSEFFRLFVAEILSSSAFRDRHPHFHRRWVPLEDLEHVTLPELTASELAEQAKYEREIAAGDRLPAIKLELVEDSTTPAFLGPNALLAAVRDAELAEVWAHIRYDSAAADSFWTARQADRVIVDPRRLLTEDGETFIAEDGHALILESGTS
jgi:hypothetical protein